MIIILFYVTMFILQNMRHLGVNCGCIWRFERCFCIWVSLVFLLKKPGLTFTVLHGTQTQSSDENSVSLSVCLSDKRAHCDKTEEKSVRFLYHAKDNLAYFSENKNGCWGGDPFYLKLWTSY